MFRLLFIIKFFIEEEGVQISSNEYRMTRLEITGSLKRVYAYRRFVCDKGPVNNLIKNLGDYLPSGVLTPAWMETDRICLPLLLLNSRSGIWY
jgi:hypothetical protein